MQKHKTNCQQCGQEFKSNRSDAKYCSNSCKTRASQLRLNKNTVINITYDEDEHEQLSEIAEIFDLSIHKTQCKHIFERALLEYDRTIKKLVWLPEYDQTVQWMTNTKVKGWPLLAVMVELKLVF